MTKIEKLKNSKKIENSKKMDDNEKGGKIKMDNFTIQQAVKIKSP